MIITLITISLFLISLIFVIVEKVKEGDCYDWDDSIGKTIFLIVTSVLLFVIILFLAVDPTFYRAEIAEFHSVQKSLEFARGNTHVTPLELIAIQRKVIEKNEWLAKAQFWTRHKLTNWFWPKEMLELTPIR